MSIPKVRSSNAKIDQAILYAYQRVLKTGQENMIDTPDITNPFIEDICLVLEFVMEDTSKSTACSTVFY